jgi:TRAP-type mannitol/chloroaromatic compound transport system permease small subunit
VTSSDRQAPGKQEASNKRRPQRLFELVILALNSAGSGWVCFLMVLICADIASRGLLNQPVNGVAEIVALSIVICVFLQLSHTLAVGRLTRADILLRWLSEAYPRASHLPQLISHLLGAIVFALIAYASYPILLDSWARSEYVGQLGTFTAPTWPAKLVVVVGSILTCIQFLVLAAGNLRGMFAPGPDRRPAKGDSA